jgi:non-canonical poly(A) RNA polymerase PAPD5/7
VRGANNRISGAKSVKVESFGSFAAGLYLPTADMDLVAVSPGYLTRGIKSFCQSNGKVSSLGYHLANSGVAMSMTPITKARVPIVKFTDKTTGIKVDISFENDSGLKANRTFQQWKHDFPAMPVIVVLIKQLLCMRGLNEVFNGGLGGFSIICLVVSMLQHMPQVQAGAMDQQRHYGELLMEFLDLYGNKFDITATAISMDPPGYIDKTRHPNRFAKDNSRLAIIDPNNSSNDISSGTRNIAAVFNCFRSASNALEEHMNRLERGEDVDQSILGCVLGGNYNSFTKQRDKLRKVHQGEGVSTPPPPPPPPPPGTYGSRGSRVRPTKAPAAVNHPLPSKPTANNMHPNGVQNGARSRKKYV